MRRLFFSPLGVKLHTDSSTDDPSARKMEENERGWRVSARMVMRGLWRWPLRRGHWHQSLEVSLSPRCLHNVCPPYECMYVLTANNHGWRQGFVCQNRKLYHHQPPLGSIDTIVPASKSGSLMPEQPSVGLCCIFKAGTALLLLFRSRSNGNKHCSFCHQSGLERAPTNACLITSTFVYI